MPTLKQKLNKLPSKPGVYQFKDRRGDLIYIGKAKNLKKRVNSYFQGRRRSATSLSDDKTNELVKRIADVEIITTKNEMEALILEASLIKKNKPPYNIDLKESSGRYAYLKITDDKFPRLITARGDGNKENGKLFGPYTSAQTRKEAQYLANTTFKLRACNKLPKTACLLYHIHLCSAPCIKKISIEEYNDNIKKAEQFLKGEILELKKQLEQEMKGYSDDLKYEQAKARRDQIIAIARLQEKQNIDLPKGYDQDVINYISTPTKMIFQIFNINKGLITSKNEFHARSNDVSEFIRRYYDSRDIPEEIILPKKLTDQKIMQKYLTEQRGAEVKITIPQKGSKLDLLKLLKQNLEISSQVGNAVLYELQQALNLPSLPQVIEMFDISHTSGREISASLVQFRGGQPDKSNYRRFKIKTVPDNDDFASMREVVYRRYKKLTAEKKEMPDLIMVDGGRGQLSSALGILRELGISVPVIALAKREEEIYTVGRRFPARLAKKSESLKLIQRVRDEAHRFAIKYHRWRRSKNFATMDITL